MRLGETMARRRRRAEPGVIELVLEGGWQHSAVLAGLLLGLLAILSMLAHGGGVTGIVLGFFRPVLWLSIGLLALLALIKYLIAQRRGSRRRMEEYLAADNMKRQIGRIVDSARTEAEDQDAVDEPNSAATSKPSAWSIEVLRAMEWKRFEDFCAELYRALGIRCETTSLGADGGIDIRLFEDAADPQRCTAIVQCKAWGERDVGVRPVRELRGVMAHEHVTQGFFVAPGSYTDEARIFAATNHIALIDGALTLAMIARLSAAHQSELLTFAIEGDWTTPTCPHCGIKMVAREGAGYRFWGCRHFPRCRQRINMRVNA